jgi:formamidopyrimidine-DNA glycosylase
MPELPDLEVIKSNLEKRIKGFEVKSLKLLKKSVGKPSPEIVEEALKGDRISSVSRRGKYTLLHLESGATLLIHLMLEGEMDLKPSGSPAEKGTCAVLSFKEGQELHFMDKRGWMKLYFVPPGELEKSKELGELGPEPFHPSFTPEYLGEALKKFKGTVKFALIEQRLLAGIGNAYSDEILFCAKIAPSRPARELSEREKDLLFKCIQDTLRWGTEETRKRMGDGIRGEIREFLNVHGKEGEPCPRCGTKILRIEIEGRGTYFCPRCQK